MADKVAVGSVSENLDISILGAGGDELLRGSVCVPEYTTCNRLDLTTVAARADNLVVWALLSADAHARCSCPDQSASPLFRRVRLKCPTSMRTASIYTHDLFFGSCVVQHELGTRKAIDDEVVVVVIEPFDIRAKGEHKVMDECGVEHGIIRGEVDRAYGATAVSPDRDQVAGEGVWR